MVKKLIGNLKHIVGFGSSGANKNVVTDENGDLKVENKPSIPTESITTPVADTTSGAIGGKSTYAKADHSHPISGLYAGTSHTHGDITNTGTIGSTANKPLITTTNGKIATGSFGTTANTFCQGNDSRLSNARTPTAHTHTKSEISDFPTSMTPTSHTHTKSEITDFPSTMTPSSHNHGNLQNGGTISVSGTIQKSQNVVTDANGYITTEAKPTANATASNIKMDGTQSAGSLTSFAKADHVHPTDTSRIAVYQGPENNGKFLKVTNGNVACESVTIPSAYTHPTYTARTGKPTGNQTPSFGGTFTVSQITSDGTGHVTGATDRTVTIPSLPTASTSQAGIIQIGTEASNASAGDHTHPQYLTSHQDISGKEDTSNKVTSWSHITNNTRYPSERLVKDSLDNKANFSHTHTSSQISDLMSKVYPVGAVYISVNDTDPATLFGGTWQRLQDTFLYATSGTADTGYQATAGEATHTLTTNEIPAHTHNIGSLSRYTASGKAGAAVGDGNGNTLNYHTSSTGSGAAHNNMPPYMKVYMWKRTAL